MSLSMQTFALVKDRALSMDMCNGKAGHMSQGPASRMCNGKGKGTGHPWPGGIYYSGQGLALPAKNGIRL